MPEIVTNKRNFLDTHRIYVVLAQKVRIRDGSHYTMEVGRMMAQVGHVVSKLKMFWAARPVMFGAKVDKNTLNEVYKWVEAFTEQPVTTIVKLARDCDELSHIAKLATDASLWPVCPFLDDNPEVYGKDCNAFTALAIGPTTKDAMVGICDYLPLFR